MWRDLNSWTMFFLNEFYWLRKGGGIIILYIVTMFTIGTVDIVSTIPIENNRLSFYWRSQWWKSRFAADHRRCGRSVCRPLSLTVRLLPCELCAIYNIWWCLVWSSGKKCIRIFCYISTDFLLYFFSLYLFFIKVSPLSYEVKIIRFVLYIYDTSKTLVIVCGRCDGNNKWCNNLYRLVYL